MSALPAVFVDRSVTYHADTCDLLSLAGQRGEVDVHMWSHGTYPGSRLPDPMLPELCSMGVWDAARPQSWGLDWHRNEGLELTFLEQGSLDFSVDGSSHRLLPGDLTITRPWQRHCVGGPLVSASRLHWFILDLDVRQPHADRRWPAWLVLSSGDMAELTERLRGNEQPVWPADRELGECFRKVAEVLVAPAADAAFESRLKVRLNGLFLCLLEMLRRSTVPLNPALASAQRTVAYFLARLPQFLDAEWSLDSMAAECNMARSQFALYCRRLSNRSPMHFLADCRIEAAKRLLSGSEGPAGRSEPMTVTEVAGICGFSSSQYFATQFRKHTGLSPAEFRRSQAKRPIAETSKNP